MNKSDSIKELAAALARAQAEFPAVPENATNPFLKNRYADLGAVIASAKATLAKHGLSVSQLPYSEAERIGVTTLLMHSSGEFIEAEMSIPLGEDKGRSLAQNAGAIITYLRRYGYSSILGLYTDEDTDGAITKKLTEQATKKPEPTAVEQFAKGTPGAVVKADGDKLSWARSIVWDHDGHQLIFKDASVNQLEFCINSKFSTKDEVLGAKALLEEKRAENGKKS